jgi:hypothetical protein
MMVGGVAERLKALVLKTSRGKPLVGSNPTPSATSAIPSGVEGSTLGDPTPDTSLTESRCARFLPYRF